jgi:hypothetical protein
MMSNLDIIKSRFNNPNLKEVHSKKTGKDYWIFEYEVVDLNKSNIYNYLYKDDYVDNNEPKLKYYKIIRTNEDIDKSFEYFMDTDQLYGLDYETDGIPFDDPNFKHMGVGIAGANGISAYYDIEWMNSVGSNYEHFKDRYKKFADTGGARGARPYHPRRDQDQRTCRAGQNSAWRYHRAVDALKTPQST